MSRKENGQQPDFGARLSALRKAAGYAQQELAQELGVSTDEFLGVATPRRRAAKPDRRLQRRIQRPERMNPKEKRQALQILDARIEREQRRATKG